MRRLIALGVLLAAAAWLLWRPQTQPADRMRAAGGSADVAQAQAAAPVRNAVAAPSSAGDSALRNIAIDAKAAPEIPFAQHRVALQQRAASGDARAAGELGSMLIACPGYVARSGAEIEQALIGARAAGESSPVLNGVPVPPELQLVQWQVLQQELDRRCAGGAGQVSWEDRKRALPLLAQAADAGDTQAMLDYARNAFVDYDDTAALLRDPAGVKARRDRARAYLQRALQAGDARALRQFSDIYTHGGLYPRDALAAYAHLLAFLQSDAGRKVPPPLREFNLHALAQGLQPGQLEQADEQAQRLVLQLRAGAGL